MHLNTESQQFWALIKSQLAQQKLQMLNSNSLTIGNRTMKFSYKQKGSRPPNGYILIFGFHGGGGCAPQINDNQCNNHKNLYNEYLPQGSIWFVPRSIQNLSDMWWRQQMQQFILQIIHAFVLNDIVDINRVFLTGYSAGGDGIYHMGPRMPDHLAGAAMMAGHPNKVNIMNVRNIGFSIQVGGNDSAYNRANQGIKYSRMLKQLGQNYGGYQNRCRIHEGSPHWMGKKDAQIFGWLFKLVRNPYPNVVLYKKIQRQHLPNFYYLRIGPNKNPSSKQDEQTFVFKTGNKFQIFSNRKITILLNHRMINPQQPILVYHNYKQTHNKMMGYNSQIIQKTIMQRMDPYYVFQDQFISQPPNIINIYEAMLKQFNITREQKQAQYEEPLSFKPEQTPMGFSKSVNALVQRQRPYPNRVGVAPQGYVGNNHGYSQVSRGQPNYQAYNEQPQSQNIYNHQPYNQPYNHQPYNPQHEYQTQPTYSTKQYPSSAKQVNQQFVNSLYNPYTMYQKPQQPQPQQQQGMYMQSNQYANTNTNINTNQQQQQGYRNRPNNNMYQNRRSGGCAQKCIIM